MKPYKTLLLLLAWIALGLLVPALVMGRLGPQLERTWVWGVAHLPGQIQGRLQIGWMHVLGVDVSHACGMTLVGILGEVGLVRQVLD